MHVSRSRTRRWQRNARDEVAQLLRFILVACIVLAVIIKITVT